MAPSPLLTPFTLGGDLPLKNRMVLSPMTRGRAGDTNCPNAMMARYYVQRASAGLLITEGTFVSPVANGWAGAPEIYSPAATAGWKEVTDKVHDAGGLIFCQLWHCGRASHSSFHPTEGRAVAPSAIAIGEPTIHTPNGKVPHEVPNALTVDGIKATVADFAAAAANAKAAGFDGVEIHGANGYLIDEFLQTKTNKRTDEYSGESLEGRFRFLKEVLEAVLGVWPANRVGVRLSPNGVYNDQVRWERERGGRLVLKRGFGTWTRGRRGWPAGGCRASWPFVASRSLLLEWRELLSGCLGAGEPSGCQPAALLPILCLYQPYSYSSLFLCCHFWCLRVRQRLLPIDVRLLVCRAPPTSARPSLGLSSSSMRTSWRTSTLSYVFSRAVSVLGRREQGRVARRGCCPPRRRDVACGSGHADHAALAAGRELPHTAPTRYTQQHLTLERAFPMIHVACCLFLHALCRSLFSPFFLIATTTPVRASPRFPPPPPLPLATQRRLGWALASTSSASRWLWRTSVRSRPPPSWPTVGTPKSRGRRRWPTATRTSCRTGGRGLPTQTYPPGLRRGPSWQRNRQWPSGTAPAPRGMWTIPTRTERSCEVRRVSCAQEVVEGRQGRGGGRRRQPPRHSCQRLGQQ